MHEMTIIKNAHAAQIRTLTFLEIFSLLLEPPQKTTKYMN